MQISPPRLSVSEIESWLREDSQFGDITSEATIPANSTSTANLVAKKNGVIAGISIVTQLLDYMSIEYTESAYNVKG